VPVTTRAEKTRVKAILEVLKTLDFENCPSHSRKQYESLLSFSKGGLYFQDTVNGSTKFIAVGVVSYGDGCAQPQKRLLLVLVFFCWYF
jgi:hypothetical protein